MRTATSNIVILSAEIGTSNITGTAIDGDIKVLFAVANTDVNQRLFVPESQLVVTGKFRIGQEVASIGIYISKIIAVISIPAPVEVEAEIEVITTASVEPEPEVAPKLTAAQKRKATIAAKKALATV